MGKDTDIKITPYDKGWYEFQGENLVGKIVDLPENGFGSPDLLVLEGEFGREFHPLNDGVQPSSHVDRFSFDSDTFGPLLFQPSTEMSALAHSIWKQATSQDKEEVVGLTDVLNNESYTIVDTFRSQDTTRMFIRYTLSDGS